MNDELKATTADVFRKDAILDRLAERFNVAQFVGFAPSDEGPVQTFSRLSGYPPNHRFVSPAEAVAAVLACSPEGLVNVRTFRAGATQGQEFLYGLRTAQEAIDAVERHASAGNFCIVNETIDIHDGGVSGVLQHDLVEFRPDATPRGVERGGFASLPSAWAARFFDIVFGYGPDVADGVGARVEFSVHPRRRGYGQTHVVYWEHEWKTSANVPAIEVRWPNAVSAMMGDKAYGLLLAHLAGMPVPRTVVMARRLAPFAFGEPTKTHEVWTRTCPTKRTPGKFATVRGWVDPFALLAKEDPDGTLIASVLSQDGVDARWSGAAIELVDGSLCVEGIEGTGETFMSGLSAPQRLPPEIASRVTAAHRQLFASFGSVSFEWVADRSRIWILQLHVGASTSDGTVLVPGTPSSWEDFDLLDGLEALRTRLQEMAGDTGLVLHGDVGLSSHMVDVAIESRVPTLLKRSK